MKKYNTIYIYIGEEEQDKIILEKDWSYIYYSIPFSFPNAILEAKIDGKSVSFDDNTCIKSCY